MGSNHQAPSEGADGFAWTPEYLQKLVYAVRKCGGLTASPEQVLKTLESDGAVPGLELKHIKTQLAAMRAEGAPGAFLVADLNVASNKRTLSGSLDQEPAAQRQRLPPSHHLYQAPEQFAKYTALQQLLEERNKQMQEHLRLIADHQQQARRCTEEINNLHTQVETLLWDYNKQALETLPPIALQPSTAVTPPQPAMLAAPLGQGTTATPAPPVQPGWPGASPMPTAMQLSPGLGNGGVPVAINGMNPGRLPPRPVAMNQPRMPQAQLPWQSSTLPFGPPSVAMPAAPAGMVRMPSGGALMPQMYAPLQPTMPGLPFGRPLLQLPPQFTQAGLMAQQMQMQLQKRLPQTMPQAPQAMQQRPPQQQQQQQQQQAASPPKQQTQQHQQPPPPPPQQQPQAALPQGQLAAGAAAGGAQEPQMHGQSWLMGMNWAQPIISLPGQGMGDDDDSSPLARGPDSSARAWDNQPLPPPANGQRVSPPQQQQQLAPPYAAFPPPPQQQQQLHTFAPSMLQAPLQPDFRGTAPVTQPPQWGDPHQLDMYQGDNGVINGELLPDWDGTYPA